MHGGGATVPCRFIPGLFTHQHGGQPRAGGLPSEGGDYTMVGLAQSNFITMNNQERIQARIARSKARKAEKRKPLLEQYGKFERVITMQNFLHSLQRRRKDVEWKGSVQTYLSHAIVKMKRTKDGLILRNRLEVNGKIRHMRIHERGKTRDIHAIMIDSRVVQGAVCDYCITPLTQPSLIYDNPASTKGKGVTHARKRVEKFLHDLIKEQGTDGYILTYDFSGYFDSIPHALCREKLAKAGLDERLQDLTMHFIKMYVAQDISELDDEKTKAELMEALANDQLTGCTLGSQISQNMALVVPNELDHTVKDEEATKGYCRFMDDGLATGTKNRLQALMQGKIMPITERLGLKINPKKTHITKMSKGVTFLKIRYIATETGKLVKKIAKEGVTRMRRKLKRFRRLVDIGKMRLDDAFSAFRSWFGNAEQIAQTYRQRKEMLKLYNHLFKRYRTGGLIA